MRWLCKGLGCMPPVWWRVGAGALAWLLLISFLHLRLNGEPTDRRIVKMGYMPVVTNLAAPLLDHASRGWNGPWFQAVKFASFAEMAEALRHGEIQAAFMIAPLAIVLRQQGEDVKVVYIGNRHESTLVTRKDLSASTVADLAGYTVAVPMRYSGHNICIREQIKRHGVEGKVNVVEMNPPDMASALATGSLDAYFVGEPFAAQSIRNGTGRLLFHVEEVWPGFICNLMLVRQDFIDQDPDLVRAMVWGAVRSGLWAEHHGSEAARIAASYWNQPVELVEYALNTPPGRIVYDRYLPRQDEMEDMARRMENVGLLEHAEIDGLVFDSFARSAPLEDIGRVEDILVPGK